MKLEHLQVASFDSSLQLILFGLDFNRIEPVVVAVGLLENFDFGFRDGEGRRRDISLIRWAMSMGYAGGSVFLLAKVGPKSDSNRAGKLAPEDELSAKWTLQVAESMNQPQYSSEAGGGLAALGGVGDNGPPQLPLSDLEKSSARKVRKEAEKQRKQAKKYEEQLKKIRGPKSQKIQIIDESFLEKYNHAQTLPPGPSLKTKKRSKKTPSEMVQLNLSDCLRDRLSLAEKGELGPGGVL
ncbi:conserved hypothetical protein [Culex quinquefasciatus]|uniref:Uncharacterized protein n=1 Tax=Culex quinquefasciatus TaxID=7176 RepID=B0XLI2_CULQU|nr:conserved hypothetical protein [Culex quinquefasciatus]|eukprot:XP_001870504.1 conserved hypothetical protein [Culex quinquefasciatus]